MRIILDEHPVLAAVGASSMIGFSLVLCAWLAAHGLRKSRAKNASGPDRRGVRVGTVGLVLFIAFGVWWWFDWSPWAVELTDNAVELKYLLSTRRIEYADVEGVEFKLEKRRRGHRERSIVRLSAGGRVYKLTQDPKPFGDLARRPVRQVFDQLANRLPPHIVREVSQ